MTTFHFRLCIIATSTLLLFGCFGNEANSKSPAGSPDSVAVAANTTGEPPATGEAPDAISAGDSKGVRGAVLDLEGKPIEGVAVTVAVGGEGSMTTSADGKYNFRKLPAGDVVLHFGKRGLIDTYQGFHVWVNEDPRIDVEMNTQAVEEKEFQEAHGTPWDATKGVLIVQFEVRDEESENVYGGGAVLDAKGAVGKVFTAKDTMVAGTVVPEGSASPSVEFTQVPEGDWPFTITPPAGLDCAVPSKAMIRPGAYTVVLASCEKPTP